MTELQFDDANLIIEVKGADKLWALKSQLVIPLKHVVSVHYSPEVARGWFHGLKLPGSDLPGVLTAGTFYQHGKKVFWDVHHPEKTIVIDLQHESYNQLIIEVEDPQQELQRLLDALKG